MRKRQKHTEATIVEGPKAYNVVDGDRKVNEKKGQAERTDRSAIATRKSEDGMWSEKMANMLEKGRCEHIKLRSQRNLFRAEDALHFIIVCTDMQCEPRAAINCLTRLVFCGIYLT
jgi:hypothetical protein